MPKEKKLEPYSWVDYANAMDKLLGEMHTVQPGGAMECLQGLSVVTAKIIAKLPPDVFPWYMSEIVGDWMHAKQLCDCHQTSTDSEDVSQALIESRKATKN